MLGKLFGSKSRVKILKLFLLHPGERFYLRQIARDLRLQPNSVRRELENLSKFGLIIARPKVENKEKNNNELPKSRELILKSAVNKKNVKSKKINKEEVAKSDKKYYTVNTNFVLYEEIKALIIKAQILYEKDFIEKLHQAGQAKLLVLTGLFVNNPQAPVDLLIVGRLNKVKILKLIKSLENDLGREINFTLMGAKEFKYRRDITDVFLYEILEGKNIIVIDEVGVS